MPLKPLPFREVRRKLIAAGFVYVLSTTNFVPKRIELGQGKVRMASIIKVLIIR